MYRGVAAGSLLFPASHVLLQACTSPQVPPSRCFWRLSRATAVMSRWAAEGWEVPSSWLGRRYCADLPVACRGRTQGVDALRPQGTPKEALLALRKGVSLSHPRGGHAWTACMHPWGRQVRKDRPWQGEFIARERQGKQRLGSV